MKRNTTPAVEWVGELNIEGNIIPHSWYQHIKWDSGKTDTVAIILLSDVLYWYRPTIVRDETTGVIIAVNKKFKSDMLQKQYESWGELFGFTKRQTKDAVDRLVSKGLLHREFRNIKTATNMKLSNVMFIEPVITEVKGITFAHAKPVPDVHQGGGGTLQRNTPPATTEHPPTPDVGTYTDITTETTSSSNASSIPASAPTQENVQDKKDDDDSNPKKEKTLLEEKEVDSPYSGYGITSLLEVYKMEAKKEDSKALNAILLATLDKLGVDVHKKDGSANWALVQKLRNFGDKRLLTAIWAMYQAKETTVIKNSMSYLMAILKGGDKDE